jgi:general secretion pathway protein D
VYFFGNLVLCTFLNVWNDSYQMLETNKMIKQVTHPLRILMTLLVSGVLLLQGCQTTENAGDDLANTQGELKLPNLGIPKADVPDESPLLSDKTVQKQQPDKIGDATRERIVDRKDGDESYRAAIKEILSKRAQGRGVSYPPGDLIGEIENGDEKVPVEFSFDAAPLTEVVPLFATLLEFSYVIDPTVKGAVTMSVDVEMTKRETWDFFQHILWLSGAYATRNESGSIDVMPFSKMPEERRLFVQHEPKANVAAHLIPIYNTDVKRVIPHLQPFLTKGGIVKAVDRLNAIMLVEAPKNMAKIRNLIAQLDVPGEASWPHAVVTCNNVDAEVVLEELQNLLPVLGYTVANKTPSAGAIKLSVLPRMQAVVVSAALPAVVDKVVNWIGRLDVTNVNKRENIYFYNVKHSTPDHLSEALGVFFGESSVTSRTPSSSSGGDSNATSSRARPPGSRNRNRSTSNKDSEMDTDSIFSTPLSIYADNELNRLAIRTTPRAYPVVHALLERLDLSPRQVVIQAVIAEVTLSKSTEYGVSYKALQTYKDYIFEHASYGTGQATFPDPVDLESGFALRFKRGEDQLGFLRALAGDNDVRVLSSPQITALSDEEAKINVGDRVPVITGDYTDTSGNNITRDIQYEDTGTILTVTPHITAGNEVKLKVNQQVSDAVETESSDIESPTIRERELNTQLVVPDGGTALLGGLIRTERTKKRTGVPVLMNIPGVGKLFGTNDTNNQRNELLVLLTVNVVQDQDATNQLLRRYEAALKEIQKGLDL